MPQQFLAMGAPSIVRFIAAGMHPPARPVGTIPGDRPGHAMLAGLRVVKPRILVGPWWKCPACMGPGWPRTGLAVMVMARELDASPATRNTQPGRRAWPSAESRCWRRLSWAGDRHVLGATNIGEPGTVDAANHPPTVWPDHAHRFVQFPCPNTRLARSGAGAGFSAPLAAALSLAPARQSGGAMRPQGSWLSG